MLPRFRFSVEELSGSLADMGSMVPFIIGAVLIADFKLAPVLLMFAAAHIATGLYYGIPMSVQPMKVIGALVIAGGLTHGQAVGAGLVAITPGAGFVTPMAALLIGLIAGIVCYWAVMLKGKLGYDDSLDVFGVHGAGGITGALLTGVFASVGATGLLLGNSHQLLLQIEGVIITIVYAGVCTILIGFVLDRTMGLKVTESEENIGLDKTCHGETAYNL